MKIVYIEDNQQDRELVERFMRTTAHALATFSTVEEAAPHVEDADLVLVDILIGQARRGLEFAAELRAHGLQSPLVAVTALTQPQELAAYRAQGFDDVLAKPFEIDQLADLIDRFDHQLT